MPIPKGQSRHFDICLQERFYFGDTVLPLFESGIPLVRQRMKALPDADNITIAYPDEGAWKRFHYQFGDYPEASLTPASAMLCNNGVSRQLGLRNPSVFCVINWCHEGRPFLHCHWELPWAEYSERLSR